MSSPFPPPADEARALSDTLQLKIRDAAAAAGGCLPFAAFMNMALYEPGLGYYANGLMPFGAEGDFITAPESGTLFGRCVARSIASVLGQLGGGEVLELGAGSGALARTVLEALRAQDALPTRYRILERSGAMRALQARAFADDEALLARVEWLEALPEHPLEGVIVGNEVADALPVERFRWCDGQLVSQGVAWPDAGLGDCERAPDAATADFVHRLAADFGWRGEYRSEYCPSLGAWVDGLCGSIARGLLLLVDYGYGRAEYYHPQRSMGTLMCHYRHRAHADALWYPGLQDITAFVDFTRIAEAASDAGLKFTGYTSQAQFLAACGIDSLLAQVSPDDTQRFLVLANEAKRLMLPGEMGERFKAIAFSRDLHEDVVGFSPRDLRGRL